MTHPRLLLSALVASSFLATSWTGNAATAGYMLDEYQTIDSEGLFPATGSNNVDKFDTLGTTAGSMAPFTTGAYVRGATGVADRRVQLFLQFDLGSLAAEQINSATLSFSAFSLNDLTAAANSPNLYVSQLAQDWAASQGPDPVYNAATIGDAIDGGGVTSGLGTDVDAGGVFRNVTPYSIDITSIVQNWQGGDANNGLLLHFQDAAAVNQGIGIDGSTASLNVTTIPEPSSLSLLGIAGLLVLRRRQRA